MSYGSLGLGAVWGYLLGWLEAGPRSPMRTLLASALAMALAGMETWLMAGTEAAWAFGLASLAFFLLHTGFRRMLRKTRSPSLETRHG